MEYDPEPVELYVEDIRWSSMTERIQETPKSRHFFHLVDNPSFEDGYTLLESDADKTRTLELVVEGTPVRVWSRVVVSSNTDPRVRALVILVGVHLFGRGTHRPKFHCFVSPLSEIDGAWTVRHGGDHLEPDFNTAASRHGIFDGGDELSLYEGLECDRVSKQMPSGHTISVAIHPGLQNAITDTRGGTWMIHNYRVAIAFTPPNPLSQSPVNPRPVYPRHGAPLPKLTIYGDVLFSDRPIFVPSSTWDYWPDIDGGVSKLTWTPTEQDKTAALAIFIKDKLAYPLFKFNVEGSDIVLELANDPPGLGRWSYSDYDGTEGVMMSYVDEINPTDLGTWKRYRFPTDFPVEVEMDGRTMQIELTNQKFSLNDVASFQMVLRTPQQNSGSVNFISS
ncbi:hypothetical protein GALMADRAFT_253424 [Galerina marginata CBS 339.88]|uniref:Uncharacterized protein n=1 Tax=Galerina marginata (strain CBS 339.88) TaxID=685588 RepID=A0A067SLC0_GALM3|nr:hypothetical protein GALMADRAFT_253424 [Galerina marginata CBS 339.88]